MLKFKKRGVYWTSNKRVNIGRNFHIHIVHLDIIKVFYSATDAQVNCLKNNFKIYITLKHMLHCSEVLPNSATYTH